MMMDESTMMMEEPKMMEKGKMMEMPKTGEPGLGALLLPAAVLLVGTGVMGAYLIRRRGQAQAHFSSRQVLPGPCSATTPAGCGASSHRGWRR